MGYVPYLIIGEDLQVCHSTAPHKFMAYFEQPATIYGFKMAEIDLDKMLIVQREGFNDDEMTFIINFCRNNKDLMKKYYDVGGYWNA